MIQHRKSKKIITALGIYFILFTVVLAIPQLTQALPAEVPAAQPAPFVPAIGGLNLTGCDAVNPATRDSFVGCYMSALYTFMVQAAVILAVLMIIIGGFQYLLALGNTSRVSDAKETIQMALIGLVLALTSYLLFNLINSRLTDRGLLNVMTINIQPQATSTLSLPAHLATCNFTVAAWPQMYKLSLDGLKASSKQIQTAHPQLIVALQKLDDRLQGPDAQNVIASINSITDGNIFLGSCVRNTDGKLSNDCQHCGKQGGVCKEYYSYHYGGEQNACFFDSTHPPISCAVDIGSATQQGYITLERLMTANDSGFTFVQCESNTAVVACSSGTADHIHGQINNCESLLQPAS